MKKNLQKKKHRRETIQVKKSKFAYYKEDFVITQQEEKEGGYFGRHNFNFHPDYNLS